MAETVKEKIRNTGLHFCKHYNNVVRFNPQLCGKCPHSGLSK